MLTLIFGEVRLDEKVLLNLYMGEARLVERSGMRGLNLGAATGGYLITFWGFLLLIFYVAVINSAFGFFYEGRPSSHSSGTELKLSNLLKSSDKFKSAFNLLYSILNYLKVI